MERQIEELRRPGVIPDEHVPNVPTISDDDDELLGSFDEGDEDLDDLDVDDDSGLEIGNGEDG